MAGRRRGARSGRGWDAAPPPPQAARRTSSRWRRRGAPPAPTGDTGWLDDDEWPEGATSVRPAVEPPAPGGPSAGAPPGAAAGSASEAAAGAQPGAAAGSAGGETRPPAELARDICLKLLAVRPRTRAELATALRRRGIPGSVAAEVLDRYDEVGLIDDAAFARAWVSSRHHGRGLARRALAGELRRRGVDDDTAGEALDELDTDTEAATARALVDRKLRGIGRAAPDAAFRRLVGMLARKGYSPDIAIRVVKEALLELRGEAAEFAELIDADALVDAAGEEDDRGAPVED